jgi:hypothetical protein
MVTTHTAPQFASPLLTSHAAISIHLPIISTKPDKYMWHTDD